MAQFLTLLSALLLFAVFSPIVCSSSEMISERRNRAPSIESSDNGAQHLSGTVLSVESRLRKGYANSKEQIVTPSSNKQAGDDSVMEKNIRSIFATNLGPGLHLFKNTPPYVNQPHFNSYNDQMLSDQAALNTPSSPPSPINDMDFFKVQRSPGGKLGIVYNDEYLSKVDKNRTNPFANKQNIGSNKETRFQTHFSDGLSLKNDKPASSLPTADHNNAKDVIHFPTEEPDESRESNEVDISDCLEDEHSKNDKVFCSHLRNYPKKSHLENLIKLKFPNLESFLGEDLEPIKNVSSRINAPEEEYLCKSRVRVIYPQSGLNKDYNWLYIVNSENYKQGIRIEECLDTGATCGENTGLSLPKHYTATCEQGYIYRSLIAYANETIVKDTFRVPSCCKCVLRSY